MADKNMKYCEYFDVDEDYFPCIDESAINKGVIWGNTYPHESFIDLLSFTEKMLSGITNRSIWVHGAYGTGKSQCAYALKQILKVSEDEIRQYWNKYESLKKLPALLEKIIGHKEQGILTVYRYASGSITNSQLLFYAVQESIKNALEENDIPYKGENALKESAIAWLEDPIHGKFVDELLKKPKWMSTFSQSTAEEIINSLKKSSDVSSLMDNLFSLASEEGITALNLTVDSLKHWILDIIEQNNIKIVFIWDEFSDYFRKNGDSLSDFQKLVSICQEAPFYLMIVTHPLSSLTKRYDFGTGKDNPWTVVQQRFDKIEISLPDNIAFDLIHHAFDVKPAAKKSWEEMTKDLDAAVSSSKEAVAKAINIQNKNVVRNILPIHPMAAVVLKNIASAFQSNQRSMFDFIKTPKDMDVEAFQWFIQKTGPMSERPLFTVDMLWDFFYEKGKDYLSSDIKMILDTFSQHTGLNEREKVVLKTILTMESIDKRLGGTLSILKPTDQNLSYAFEGDKPEYENECKNIARGLFKKGVLNENPLDGGKKVYTTAVLAGDGAKVEAYKKEIREKSSTAKLVSDAPDIATALSLTPPLKIRYATDIESGRLPIVTIYDFKKTMDALKSKDICWRCYAVLALAKTDDEAKQFRKVIKEAVNDPEYKNIIIVDALSTPLGLEAYDQYIEYSAMSMNYSGNRNIQSQNYAIKAKNVLDHDWKNRIHDGQFIVYTCVNPEGEKASGATAVHTILQTIVLTRFPYVQDFTKNLTESPFKLKQAKNTSRIGMGDVAVKGLISGCEKYVLGKFWGKEKYWVNKDLSDEPIVKIKNEIDSVILNAFKTSGKISIREIYDFLEDEYGFSPCDLSAFITGFLLKEYRSDPYRCMDEEGHRDPMTPEKLSEMIGNYIGGKYSGKNPKITYIVSLTEEERAFYDLTESAWEIPANACTSPENAGSLVSSKMKALSYPAWCLEDVDTTGVYDLVKMYITLVQSSGDNAHDIANEIGKIAIKRQSSAKCLHDLLTEENCQKGMLLFLEGFEGGKLLDIANEIGAQDSLLFDIKKRFNVKHSALWDITTGIDEIEKLMIDYEVVRITNILLNSTANSKDGAFKSWRESLKFVGFSCESIKAKKPLLNNFFNFLLRIVNFEDILPDNMKSFLEEMTSHKNEIRELLDDTLTVFTEIYSPYLDGFSSSECEEIKNSITADMFTSTPTAANATVKKAADEYRKNQIKTQLFKLWNDTTGTKNPRQWSEKFRTPILCCINSDNYLDAKKAFSTLNSSTYSEADINDALAFIKEATFFDDIADSKFRDKCFAQKIIRDYTSLLTDLDMVRNSLEDMGISAYEWNDNPIIQEKISAMASAEYNAGGSDKAVDVIKNMTDAELKKWLTDIVKMDMGLGVKIIINGKG